MVLGRISEENEVASQDVIKKIETSNIWINMEIKSKYLISPFGSQNKKKNTLLDKFNIYLSRQQPCDKSDNPAVFISEVKNKLISQSYKNS